MYLLNNTPHKGVPQPPYFMDDAYCSMCKSFTARSRKTDTTKGTKSDTEIGTAEVEDGDAEDDAAAVSTEGYILLARINN